MDNKGQYQHFIGGQWISSARTEPNVNPSDISDIIGHTPMGNADDVNAAVIAAQTAFADWSAVSPEVRSDILDRAGNEILSRIDEFGDLLAREEGKTLAEGKGEVERAGRVLKYFAGEALRLSGEVIASTRANTNVEISREPIGVVGVVTPWNFPIAIPAWKIAPAIAFGNCVVFKPAELTPGCASVLVQALCRAGLPDGVLNLVFGTGRNVGSAIVEHPSVDAITFTGSNKTGIEVRTKAASRGAKVQLEMGGKNPLVVLDDADLEIALNCALNGAFFSTGQRCTASSRLIVTDAIREKFVERLTNAMEALTIGDARLEATQIGPVASRDQLASIQAILRASRQAGIELIGGELLEEKPSGFFMKPALATNTNVDDPLNITEVFGPVASIIPVSNFEEALAVANATEYGLSAGIVTRSLKCATAFKRRSKAGMVMINLPTAGVDYHVPFGGIKSSSYGSREQGQYAREFYTTVKTTYLNAG